jgi:hypothetical protein
MKTEIVRYAGGVLLCVLAALPAIAGERVATRLENGALFQLVPPENVLRMEKPAFVSRALADGFMGEFEPVIGIASGELAKAYPVWMLDGYSVINDAFGRRPIVVTWSPFSFSFAVYERVVDGDTLEFLDSGELWKDALVMIDRGTNSRWSPLEGRALDGEMQGKRLKVVTSTYTKWGKWVDLYTNSVCMTKLGRDMVRSDFTDYYDRTQQLGPANSPNPDSRLAGKELICGFLVDGKPIAVPLYALDLNKQFELEVDGHPLEVEFDQLSETAVVYSRVLGNDTLSLVRLDFTKGESYLRRQDDASTWLTFSGRGLSGTLADRSLEQIPSTLCFWFVWANHYPLTRIWEVPGSKPLE